ncbi:MAG: DNA repair protein RadA [candidate division KSB1 bacterium]|nr:DNA repair protein RadA [candidate division KSB1 bacterium]MDZ7303501.1 DNA repair protein RadA [candidate division KSB1 bacterium]MDZ7312697.1 DNA repair protein RadA [candidate division KSB1 bacterium]
MPRFSKKSSVEYVCQTCGHKSPRWIGRCPECGGWNTFVEEKVAPEPKRGGVKVTEKSKPLPLAEIAHEENERLRCSSQEFNRVLGGGVVPGSLILIGGDPGIGKSTLMLQEAAALARADFYVLYVTGEESARQTKMRAQRLGIDSHYLFILAETNLEIILDEAEKLQPKLMIVDSIQTMYRSDFESPPGSISQVRECALAFLNLAKQRSVPIFLIGHVTKEGYLAGPKALEHMVDTLLQFEGDRDHFFRILRSVKNRFGSTREIGVFEMYEQGLREVSNPSEIFLAQRKEDISGSVVVCTMEGSRPILVEVQALLTPSSYGLPQRTANGIDIRRLALLLAVIEKRVGLRVSTFDVFVNVAGGVRLEEPAADLGVVAAVASSLKNAVVDPQAVVIGEVGLGGEIRAVPQIDKRLTEAAKLGFKHAIIPKLATKGLQKPTGMEVVTVEKVEEALDRLL